MGLDEEIQEVKSEIKQLEDQQLELVLAAAERSLSKTEQAKYNHLSSVLSHRRSYLHDLVDKIPPSNAPAQEKPVTQVVENPPKLVAFHNACKNISHQLEGSSVIKLPDGVFILGNQSFGSSVYVRQCYPELLNLSLEIISQLETHHLVILGNPGIGKTFFGYYMLIYLLRQGETVVYESGKANRRLLFSPTLTAKGKRDDFADILDEQSTFYLADAVKPVDVLAKTVLLTSPRRDQWFKFSDEDCALRYMPVWSIEEIHQCRALMYAHLTEQEVQTLFDRWGGIPRYVLRNARREDQQDKLNQAFDKDTVKSVTSCIGKIGAGDNITHRLVHIHVENFVKMYYVFASAYVADKVIDHFIGDNYEELLLFILSSNDESDYAALRGYLFERIAHSILSQGGVFSTRELIPGSKDIGPQRSLELKKTQRFRFNTHQTIPNNGDFYYHPDSPTFPSIDSFIQPNLLFQMTISLKHRCKQTGLRDALNLLRDSSNPQLYFVVPEDIFDKFQFQKYHDTNGNPLQPPSSIFSNVKRIRQHVLKIDIISEVKHRHALMRNKIEE